MKTIRLMPLFLLMLLLGACGENREQDERSNPDELAMANPETNEADALMSDWKEAWNENDAERLQSLVAEDAVLFFFGEAKTGDEIQTWTEDVASWMKDLNTMPVKKSVGEKMIFEAGTFTHGSTQNDTLKYEGAYVVLWERVAPQADWEVKLMDISPKVSMDSVANPGEK